MQLLNARATPIAEVWLRKEVPAKAGVQPKNGLSYREVEETTLLGAIRFLQPATEYRQQKTGPGSTRSDSASSRWTATTWGQLLSASSVCWVPADRDTGPEPMKSPKVLHERSTRSTGTSHPAVLLLSLPKGRGGPQTALTKGTGHWVLYSKENALVNGRKAVLGVGLALVGHAAE